MDKKIKQIQHKSLAGGRWAQMPLCEQMANIGSEVSRALNWRLSFFCPQYFCLAEYLLGK